MQEKPSSESQGDHSNRDTPHFRESTTPHPLANQLSTLKQSGDQETVYTLPHPVWSEEELHSVQITHTPPEKAVDTV